MKKERYKRGERMNNEKKKRGDIKFKEKEKQVEKGNICQLKRERRMEEI